MAELVGQAAVPAAPAGSSADSPAGTVHALIIGQHGELEVTQLAPALGTFQWIVGAPVAIYYPHKDWHVYCHEATMLNVLTDVPGNAIATGVAQWADPSFGRVIRGTAVIVGTGPRGQDRDVPADVLRYLKGELGEARKRASKRDDGSK